MEIETDRIYAVLSGKLVQGSGRPRPVRQSRLLHSLEQLPELLSLASPGLPFTYFSVNEPSDWILVLPHPKDAVRAVLLSRALFRTKTRDNSFHTMIGVGMGKISSFPEPGGAPGFGAAFAQASRCLENLPRYQLFSFSDFPGLSPEMMEALAGLMDVQMQTWTKSQAAAIIGAMQGLTQEKIGQQWPEPITQQVVGRHLRRSGWDFLQRASVFLEATIAQVMLPIQPA